MWDILLHLTWKVSQHYLNMSCRENTKSEPFWSSHFTHLAALQLFLPAMQSTRDTQLLLHRVVSIVKGEPMWCTHAAGLQTSPPHGEPTFILARWLTELHESYCFYINTDAVLFVVNESTHTHHLHVNIKYIKMQNLLNFETVAWPTSQTFFCTY